MLFLEILNALAALATVAGFVLDVAGKIHERLGESARKRMERKEANKEAPEESK